MTVDELLKLYPDVRDDSGHLVRELHGIALRTIVESLVEHYGFAGLASRIPVNCFAKDPSIPSALTFLRRTPWARAKVENLYIAWQVAQRIGEPSP